MGPYHYYDTTVAENPSGFADAHGWGTMVSLAATWRTRSSPWFYQLRVNRVETKRNLDTTELLLGVGYRLEQDGSFQRNATTNGWKDRNDEIVLMAGQTIVNSFESQGAAAKSIEYRYGFTPVLRGAIGWINEGDARLIRRDGVIAQAFFEPSFYEDRFTLGVGYGAYFAVDQYHPERKVQGILSTTFSYHVARQRHHPGGRGVPVLKSRVSYDFSLQRGEILGEQLDVVFRERLCRRGHVAVHVETRAGLEAA